MTTETAAAPAPPAPSGVPGLNPVAGGHVELRIARSATAMVLGLGAGALVVAGLLAGWGGVLGAAIATALIAAMFLSSAALLDRAARISPTAMMAAALGGFALRLLGYALLIVLLRPVEAIHGPSLAVTAAVLLVASLAWEARHVSRSPGFFVVDASAGRPNAPGADAGRTSS